MYYEQRITLPANTPATAMVEETIYIHPGIVNRVEIFFPPGCVGLAHLRIYYWERQLWPSNPDSDFTGDTYPISYTEDLPIVDPPYEFIIRGWNLDDTYDHTPIVRIGVIPFERDLKTLLLLEKPGPTGPVIPYEE